MRRWNLPQVNTKVMCAVLTAATLDDLQVGDTVSFFLDGEVVTSLSVGMPEPTQPGQPMQAPEQK